MTASIFAPALITLAQNASDTAAGFAGLGLICVFSLFGLAAFIFWLWALIDAIRNPRLSDNTRLVWVLVIVFTHALGALIYVIVGRNG